MRSKVPYRKDQRIFSKTAARTKDINTGRLMFRGGTRF